jgi:hypothetical protein
MDWVLLAYTALLCDDRIWDLQFESKSITVHTDLDGVHLRQFAVKPIPSQSTANWGRDVSKYPRHGLGKGP